MLAQPGQVLQEFFLYGRLQFQFAYFLLVFIDLLVLILLAQFGVDDLELLTEIIVPLALADRRLNMRTAQLLLQMQAVSQGFF